MKTVILDTNFLFIPHQFKINIIVELEKLLESAHELVISTAILNELKEIAKGRGKDSVAARVALEGIKKQNIRVIETTEKDADSWIVEYCTKNHGTIVCTNDIILRKKLKKANVGARLIVMRTRTKIFWA